MIKRGELYYADLSPVVGSEQGGVRPILIVQNDTGNKYSPTVIAAAITSQMGKAKLPTHIELNANEYGLIKNSVILLEQIRTLDKRRLKEKIGELNNTMMKKVNTALLISLGFGDNYSANWQFISYTLILFLYSISLPLLDSVRKDLNYSVVVLRTIAKNKRFYQ